MAIAIKSEAHKWSLMAIFAALQVVATVVPYSITIGVEGSISVGLLMAPIIGILLGPIIGAIAVVIGSIVGIMLYPSSGVLGIFTPIATASGAFVAGAIMIGKGSYVPPIFAAGLIGYFISPIGMLAPTYTWLHVYAMILTLPLLIPHVSNTFKNALDGKSSTVWQLFIIALTSFIAVMTDHIIGSTIAAYYFSWGIPVPADTLAGIFRAVTLVYPVERIIATAILSLVIFVLMKALQSTSMWHEAEELRELDEEEDLE